jgi:hypothetical protein
VDSTTVFSRAAIGFTRSFDAKGVIVFCDKPTFVLMSRPQRSEKGYENRRRKQLPGKAPITARPTLLSSSTR